MMAFDPGSGAGTPRQPGAARIAPEGSVGRIVLTHVYPAADVLDLAARVGRGQEGEILVAEDSLKFEL